jgi:hypothetical protein
MPSFGVRAAKDAAFYLLERLLVYRYAAQDKKGLVKVELLSQGSVLEDEVVDLNNQLKYFGTKSMILPSGYKFTAKPILTIKYWNSKSRVLEQNLHPKMALRD